MIDRLKPTLLTYCQLWFDQVPFPVITPVIEYKYVWYEKWGNYEQGILQPYLMACQIPAKFRRLVPRAVTVVERPCDMSTAALRVVNNRPPPGQKRQDFAVCVKGLSFPDQDLSVRLVEWLETLRVLGAKKVFLYELEVHPNISKVLRYYQRQGLVEVTPLTLAGDQPNLSPLQRLYLNKMITNRRQSELVPYNDCFYRNIHRYEYVALLDTDEVIMPTAFNSWADLMTSVPAARRPPGAHSKKGDRLLQRAQRVLLRRAGPRALLAAGHPALHAHAAARAAQPQLHQAGTVRQVLPPNGPSGRAAQPLPAGLPGRLSLLQHQHQRRPAAALPRRLRRAAEEDL